MEPEFDPYSVSPHLSWDKGPYWEETPNQAELWVLQFIQVANHLPILHHQGLVRGAFVQVGLGRRGPGDDSAHSKGPDAS